MWCQDPPGLRSGGAAIKEKGPGKDTFWRDVGLYSTLGLNLAFSIWIGFYLGWRLDRQYGTAPRWIMAGFLLGLGLGLYSLFAVAARVGRRGKGGGGSGSDSGGGG